MHTSPTSTAPSEGQTCPGTHGIGTAVPVGQYVPGGHTPVHADEFDPPLPNRPAVHNAHVIIDVAPTTTEYFPGAQAVHAAMLVAPSIEPYVPPAHGIAPEEEFTGQ